MKDKNSRFYIKEYFNSDQEFKDGSILEFIMPPFCSGDYLATIYIDNDGDPYIDKEDNFFVGCRDYIIRTT